MATKDYNLALVRGEGVCVRVGGRKVCESISTWPPKITTLYL